MSTNIDEKTKIPFVWVAIASPFIVGGMLWLTTIDAKASEAQKSQARTEVLLELYEKRLQSIDNRLSRIEGKLNQ